MNPAATRPSPLAAALLSTVCTGLGQIHCGRLRRGLLLLTASLALPVGVAVGASQPAGPEPFTLLLASVGLWLVLVVLAVVDAALLARRAGPRSAAGVTLPSVLVYGLLGVVFPAGTMSWVGDHVMKAYLVPTASMAPTILPGDRVLAVRDVHPVRRGDLVVFPRPDRPERLLVKRVVGLPGETVTVRAGQVLIDGEPVLTVEHPVPDLHGLLPDDPALVARYEVLDDRVHTTLWSGSAGVPDFAGAPVPAGQLLVLGDHRSNAVDSRVFGFIPRDSIEAVVEYIFWPAGSFDRAGPIQSPRLPKDVEALIAESKKRRKEQAQPKGFEQR
jgi:signal peptidase I